MLSLSLPPRLEVLLVELLVLCDHLDDRWRKVLERSREGVFEVEAGDEFEADDQSPLVPVDKLPHGELEDLAVQRLSRIRLRAEGPDYRGCLPLEGLSRKLQQLLRRRNRLHDLVEIQHGKEHLPSELDLVSLGDDMAIWKDRPHRESCADVLHDLARTGDPTRVDLVPATLVVCISDKVVREAWHRGDAVLLAVDWRRDVVVICIHEVAECFHGPGLAAGFGGLMPETIRLDESAVVPSLCGIIVVKSGRVVVG